MEGPLSGTVNNESSKVCGKADGFVLATAKAYTALPRADALWWHASNLSLSSLGWVTKSQTYTSQKVDNNTTDCRKTSTHTHTVDCEAFHLFFCQSVNLFMSTLLPNITVMVFIFCDIFKWEWLINFGWYYDLSFATFCKVPHMVFRTYSTLKALC